MKTTDPKMGSGKSVPGPTPKEERDTALLRFSRLGEAIDKGLTVAQARPVLLALRGHNSTPQAKRLIRGWTVPMMALAIEALEMGVGGIINECPIDKLELFV